jgi:PknH-like extracellular domain
VALAGCSNPPHQTSSSAPTTSSATPTVAPDRLDSILLTVQEANPMMGTDGMEISVPIYTGTYSNNLPTMADPDCLSTDSPMLDPVYRGSGYTAIRTDTIVGPDSRWLRQGVASFPSADLALAFVENLAGKWKACAPIPDQGRQIADKMAAKAGG